MAVRPKLASALPLEEIAEQLVTKFCEISDIKPMQLAELVLNPVEISGKVYLLDDSGNKYIGPEGEVVTKQVAVPFSYAGDPS